MLKQVYDATEIATLIAQNVLSPKEVVEDTINRIEQLNPSLNAVVSRQYESALEQASSRDFSGLPFGGVPILLKDLGQEQKGQLSTSGSKLFKTYHAKQTSNYAKRLEELGFIVLGRTNTPEFGFKNISDSSLHGVVNLPDDLTRNAGGSSGGAAAAVASGMIPLAAASDGGGSIRIPASFNGLIGLKPTRGRIPVGPSSFRGWQGASVNFALTKTVRDTKRLLYYFQTCQMESPFVLPTLSESAIFKDDIKPLKIGVSLSSPIQSEVSEDAMMTVKKAVGYLEALGHQVDILVTQPIDGIEAMHSYYLMNSVETATMFDKISSGLGREVTREDMELMTWVIYQSGKNILAKTYSQILQQWDYYSAKMAQFHETYDILLTPTTNGVAPKHHQFKLEKSLLEKLENIDQFNSDDQQNLIWKMFEKSLEWTPFTQQANLTGQPSISLPIYRTNSGLSLGVQLTAAKGREDILLSLAQSFENHHYFQ